MKLLLAGFWRVFMCVLEWTIWYKLILFDIIMIIAIISILSIRLIISPRNLMLTNYYTHLIQSLMHKLKPLISLLPTIIFLLTVLPNNSFIISITVYINMLTLCYSCSSHIPITIICFLRIKRTTIINITLIISCQLKWMFKQWWFYFMQHQFA